MAGVLNYALSLNTSGFSGPMGAAQSAVRGLGSAASGAAGMIFKLAAPVAALAGGVSIFQALKKAADFESLSVSMRVLIGDAKETRRVLADLKDFSNATPFEFNDIAEGAKVLLALGGSTKTVRSELSMLGDIASGLDIPLGELATAYGKARIDGVLYAETLNQFNDKGIPVIAAMATKLKLTTTEVKQLASEGRIGFPLLQQVLSEMTSEGGKFFGMMKEQSSSTKGLLSTLKSGFDELLVQLGTPINDFLKPLLESNIGRLQALNANVRQFFAEMSAAREQGNLGEFIGASLKVAMIDAVNLFSGGIHQTIAYLGAALPVIFKSAQDILTSPRSLIFFESLANGFGHSISSAMMSALSSLPGLGELRASSKAMAQTAKNDFTLAGAALATADIAAVTAKAAADLKEANKAGEAAAAKVANAGPLIDRKDAASELERLRPKLPPAAPEPVAAPKSTAPAAPAGSGLLEKTVSKEELQKRADSVRLFELETKMLEAQAQHRTLRVRQLEREMKIEQLKLKLMQDQGLTAEQAQQQATRRVKLEERASGGSRRGTSYSAEETQRRRYDRLSEADKKKAGSFEEFQNENSTDRLGIAAGARARMKKATENADKQSLKNKPEKKETSEKKLQTAVDKIAQSLQNLGVA